jgi:multidrug efflux pump subunit AcrA (membrane-fusion protein)
MKVYKVYLIIALVIIFAFGFKFFLLSKPDTRLLYTVQEETFLETVKVSGIFHKTASETEKASAYATYQNALNTLVTAKQNKEAADAAMWLKRQVVLDAENEVNYKNENTTNPLTKEDYTSLEKLSIDSQLVQAEKDFRQSEKKYKEADSSIVAAQSQVSLAKIAYEDTLENEQVLTVFVNEIYVPKISVGQKVNVTFDALKDVVFQGNVEDIESVGVINDGVVTFETKIGIADLPSEIKPNMTAIASIILIQKENTLTIPMSALIYREGNIFVQKSNSKEGNLTEVQIGEKGFAKAEVISGLESGTEVLVRPNSKNL